MLSCRTKAKIASGHDSHGEGGEYSVILPTILFLSSVSITEVV